MFLFAEFYSASKIYRAPRPYRYLICTGGLIYCNNFRDKLVERIISPYYLITTQCIVCQTYARFAHTVFRIPHIMQDNNRSKAPRLIIATLILFAVCGMVYFFVLKKNVPSLPSADTLNESTTALVSVLRDAVEQKTPESAEFFPVAGEEHISLDSTIATKSDGRALIEITPDNITVANHNTTLVLAELVPKKNQTRIQLVSGEVWVHIERTLDLENDEFYHIETRNAVATVRGTSFRMSYHDGITRIGVDKGVVAVDQRNPETGAILEGQSTIVEAGNLILIGRGASPTTRRITPADREEEWFAYNSGKRFKADYMRAKPSPNTQQEPPTTNTPQKSDATTPPATDNTQSGQSPTTPNTTPEPSPTSEVTITSVRPETLIVDSAKPSRIYVEGTGFLRVDLLYINKQRAQITIESDTRLWFSSDIFDRTGFFDIVVGTIDNKSATRARAIEVTEVKEAPPPQEEPNYDRTY